MTELKRSLRLIDGLAMVVGIMVGAGILRTPGLVAAQLGRPWLTFVAWTLGGALAFLGSLIFAELATRYPQAGGKYVYVREAFGPRAAFLVGWVEGMVIYTAGIAAKGVVTGEYIGRLAGWPAGLTRWTGMGAVALFTGINLFGVTPGRWVQNVVTGAKILALGGVVAAAFALGTGAGWRTELPAAPSGAAVAIALAVAFQSLIWTYYGYADAGKIAEEVVNPERTLPQVFLLGIAVVTALYLLLNGAFLHVLPVERIAASNLVAGEVAEAIFGARGGTVVAGLAVLVLLASLNGSVFTTPRVPFGLARDGLAPRALARVNRGGTPWAAMLAVGLVSMALAASGTFEQLLALAIALILVIDGLTVLALFRLRARVPGAPFQVPLYPLAPALFVAVYAALFVGTAVAQPKVVAVTALVLGATYAASWAVEGGRGAKAV